MIDKNKDKRFTQIDESLVANRKKQIAKLEKESKEIEKQLENSEKKFQEVNNNLKKQRVIKKAKEDYKYQIICPCGNVYDTNNDPYARLKADRPLCRNCKERLE